MFKEKQLSKQEADKQKPIRSPRKGWMALLVTANLLVGAGGIVGALTLPEESTTAAANNLGHPPNQPVATTAAPETTTSTASEALLPPTTAKPVAKSTTSTSHEAAKKIEGKVTPEQQEQLKNAAILWGVRPQGSQDSYDIRAGGSIIKINGEEYLEGPKHITDAKQLYVDKPVAPNGLRRIDGDTKLEYAVFDPISKGMIAKPEGLVVTDEENSDLLVSKFNKATATQKFYEKAKSALVPNDIQPVVGQEVALYGSPAAGNHTPAPAIGIFLGKATIEGFGQTFTYNLVGVPGNFDEAHSPTGPGSSGMVAEAANGYKFSPQSTSMDRRNPEDSQYFAQAEAQLGPLPYQAIGEFQIESASTYATAAGMANG